MRTIGPYRLHEDLHLHDELGTVAEIWRATRELADSSSRDCTVVVVREDLAGDDGLQRLLHADGEEAVRAHAPGLLAARRVVTYEGNTVLEMEPYEGVHVGALLHRNGLGRPRSFFAPDPVTPLPLGAAVSIVSQLAALPFSVLSTMALHTGTVLVVRPGRVLVVPRFSHMFRAVMPSYDMPPGCYELGAPPPGEDPTTESAWVYLLASILFSFVTGCPRWSAEDGNQGEAPSSSAPSAPLPSTIREELAPLDALVSGCMVSGRRRTLTTLAQLHEALQAIPRSPDALARLLDDHARRP